MKSVAHEFIHGLRFADLSPDVINQSKRCILDLIGVTVAGRSTKLSKIAHDYAAQQLCAIPSQSAHLLFDGRKASRAGAAFAGAFTIDSFDAHDGHRLTKGHAGVALFPALLALSETTGGMSGQEFITTLVIGYEIATRAGIALHSSACDYHTSGAWNSIAVAAMASRVMKLDSVATMHALGIAEYHGPRSQMMRCIDHPTMVKDGSGWGALVGMSAADLAAAGFTGAPASTIEEEAPALWRSLGSRWCILEQYFKPWPVCRWAQPAIECADKIMKENQIASEDIESVKVETFTEGVRLGSQAPASTEEAQYAIGYPLAAFLSRGRLTENELNDNAFMDRDILSMLSRIELIDAPDLSSLFPGERLARVAIHLKSGKSFKTDAMAAHGDPEDPLSQQEIVEKYRGLTGSLGRNRSEKIAEYIAILDQKDSLIEPLLKLIIDKVS